MALEERGSFYWKEKDTVEHSLFHCTEFDTESVKLAQKYILGVQIKSPASIVVSYIVKSSR